MNRHGLVLIMALLAVVGALAGRAGAQAEPIASAAPVTPLIQVTPETATTATPPPFEPVSDAYEPDGTWQEAKSIASLALQNRTLSPTGDVDWAKLTVPPGVWSAGFVAGSATLTLYDQNLNSLESQITNSHELSRECAVDALPGGIYYVKVEGNSGFQTGSYTLAWDDYEDCSLRPDVRPYTQTGYSYPVVPNSVRNTKLANSTLYAGKPTYFDWFFINSGQSQMPPNYYSRVFVDGQLAFEQKEQGIFPGSVGGGADWEYTVPDSGCHIVRFETDATNVAAEFNEQNNVWEREFCWQAVSGWWGKYYNNETLSGDPVLVRDDPQLQFNWQSNSPAPGIVNSDHFSVAWTRNLQFDAGAYRFRLNRDDGMRFWIDGVLKLDAWQYGVEEHIVVADLSQGSHKLDLSVFEIDGYAAAHLDWERCYSLTTQVNPSTGGQIDPPSPPPNCGADKYIAGTVVSLTARANTGYTFGNWSGALSGPQATKSLTMDGNKSVTANFSLVCYTLTLNVNPSNGGSITPDPAKSAACSSDGQYTYGAVVSLTASANTGYTFGNWSGALSGPQATKGLTMDGNKSVTANFSPICYTLTRNVSPSGSGSITTDPAKSAACSSDGQYTYGAVVSLTARANTGYTFVNWSGALSGPQATKSLTMDGDKSVTANFSANCYTLVVTIDPIGLNATITNSPSKSPGCSANDQYTYGAVVSLMAMSPGGYTFSHWSGSLTGPQNPKNLTVDGSESVTAHFIANCYTLTRNVSPSGSGSITPDPPKSAGCPSNDQYTLGTSVSLRATPNSGYQFSSWSGALSGGTNPQSLTINGDASVTANFSVPTENCYQLLIDHTGSGSDPVASPAQSTGCSANFYRRGTVIQLTADPADGWRVANWIGTDNDSSTSTTNFVTMPSGQHTVRVDYKLNITTARRAFLPSVVHVPLTCWAGPEESNYNDDMTLATGPLCSGRIYSARDDDTFDYYFLDAAAGEIAIDMTAHAYPRVQLVLYYQRASGPPVASDTSPEGGWNIRYSGPAGRYYVIVYSDADSFSSTVYTLRVSYPTTD